MALIDFGFSSKKSSATSDYTKKGNQSYVKPEWWDTGLEAKAGSWEDFSKGMMGAGGAIAPGQQQGLDTLSWLNSEQNPALAGIQGGLDRTLAGYNEGRGAMQHVNMDLLDPIMRQDPRTAGAVGDVTAGTGYTAAQPYRDAYGTEVVDAGLNDFDVGTARAANAFRAGNIGGGGQAAGSRPVAAGVMAADAARGRGSLGAELRAGILDRAFGFGGQDASRTLTADMANQGKDLTISQANLGAAQNQDRLRFDTANQIGSNGMTYAGLGVDAGNAIRQAGLDINDTSLRNAIAQMTAAGMPIDQAIAIFTTGLAPYNTATQGFGQTTDESGTEKSTGKGSGVGFGFSDKTK